MLARYNPGALRSIPGSGHPGAGNEVLGCRFFAYSWKFPAYSGAFVLTVDNFNFLTYRSKKGSEKVLGRVLGKGFSEGF